MFAAPPLPTQRSKHMENALIKLGLASRYVHMTGQRWSLALDEEIVPTRLSLNRILDRRDEIGVLSVGPQFLPQIGVVIPTQTQVKPTGAS